MNRQFVIEAVLLAAYGQLLVPPREVEFLIPYTSIMELYEVVKSDEPIMDDASEEAHAREKIKELIAFFEEPLNKKKIERALASPWRKSPPLPVNGSSTLAPGT